MTQAAPSTHISPLIEVGSNADGIVLTLRDRTLTVPPGMARQIARALTDAADRFTPGGELPLPEVKPKGQPIR